MVLELPGPGMCHPLHPTKVRRPSHGYSPLSGFKADGKHCLTGTLWPEANPQDSVVRGLKF